MCIRDSNPNELAGTIPDQAASAVRKSNLRVSEVPPLIVYTPPAVQLDGELMSSVPVKVELLNIISLRVWPGLAPS